MSSARATHEHRGPGAVVAYVDVAKPVAIVSRDRVRLRRERHEAAIDAQRSGGPAARRRNDLRVVHTTRASLRRGTGGDGHRSGHCRGAHRESGPSHHPRDRSHENGCRSVRSSWTPRRGCRKCERARARPVFPLGSRCCQSVLRLWLPGGRAAGNVPSVPRAPPVRIRRLDWTNGPLTLGRVGCGAIWCDHRRGATGVIPLAAPTKAPDDVDVSARTPPRPRRPRSGCSPCSCPIGPRKRNGAPPRRCPTGGC